MITTRLLQNRSPKHNPSLNSIATKQERRGEVPQQRQRNLRTNAIKNTDEAIKQRRDSFQYPEEYLDLGPRIKKSEVDADDFFQSKFDIVCDVRSPQEFEDDHVIGAVNCPVLSDEQREQIGTMYVKVDAFEAKKLGAKMTAENLSKIIEKHFLDKPKETKVLVYCFRGGERSLSLAHTLS
jgi:rhodanese-related sulfurtransferase